MKVRKAVQKIVALGVGASMLGATMLGAMAADLSQYPKPLFIDEDGTFNGIIVVGDTAKTEDVIGATNILASLQAAAVKTTTVAVGGGEKKTVSGEGVKIETSSNELTLGESLKSVKTTLDEEDLPNILADGVYVNDGDDASTSFDYTQKLSFGDGTNATTVFVRDRDYEADEDNPYLMVYSPKKRGTSNKFMTYTLDFTKNAESDRSASSSGCGSTGELCDIEDTKITMLGVEYDITKAEFNTTGNNDITLELMGGATVNTLYEGETATYTLNGEDYEVHVDIISDSGDTVILTVNGDTSKELGEGQTDRVAGVELGIKQVLSNEAGEEGAGKDMVQFYLGAKKVTLYDDDALNLDYDDELEVNNEDVDSVFVDVAVGRSGNKYTIDKIVLTWMPEDKLFITEDNSVLFPGLESFKVEFAGLETGTEEKVVIEPHGSDNIQVTAPIESGEQTFDVCYVSGGVYAGLGEDSTRKLYTSTPTGAISTGNYVLATSMTEEESRVLEFDKIDNDGVVTLKDLAGTKYTGSCTSTPCTIDVGDLTVTIDYADTTNSQINVTGGLGSELFTKEGLILNLTGVEGAGRGCGIWVIEEDSNGNVGQGNKIFVNATLTSEGKTTVEKDRVGTNAFVEEAVDHSGTYWYEYADTDNYAAYTTFGTKFVAHTGGDEDWLEIYYPGSEAHAAVFVTETEASLTVTGESGTVTQTEVVPIPVSASKLASEVANPLAVNVISVGGPCVNTVSAALLGNPANCLEGFETGKAKIKLFENNGYVGLLVAGRTALDTRRATTVLSEWEKYKDKLVGKEVEVTGTSLTDISVGAPMPAEETQSEEAGATTGEGE